MMCPVQQNGHGMRVTDRRLYARYNEKAEASTEATTAITQITGCDKNGVTTSIAA
jgi:hypothetical protein